MSRWKTILEVETMKKKFKLIELEELYNMEWICHVQEGDTQE